MTSGGNEVPSVDWRRAWLHFRRPSTHAHAEAWASLARRIEVEGNDEYAQAACRILEEAFREASVAPAGSGRTAEPEVRGTGDNVGRANDLRFGAPPEPAPYAGLRLTVSGGRSREDRIRVLRSSDQLELQVSHRRLLAFGAYWLLRFLQRSEAPPGAGTADTSPVTVRAVSQWDNLDGSIERGYGGRSIFDWTDPGRHADRQVEYAKLLCSAGINTLFLNNVNASPEVLTDSSLGVLRVFANRFRPYGIRVGIAVNFGSPVSLGELSTADPLHPDVRAWWGECARRLYEAVPDLIGCLVKANSEGQPGPQDYGRGHEDGANMLADAFAPHGGHVFWRAFVYEWTPPGEPAPQRGPHDDGLSDSFVTFAPLDGCFRENVTLVVKNGPIDFQVREPLHPLLGAMHETPTALEFQVTQEYTGQDVHLCFLPSQWRHYLDGRVNANEPLCDLVKSPSGGQMLVGVSAWGDSDCWSGHPLAQANLYGLGRLAWDPTDSPQRIATDWTRQTFGADPVVESTLVDLLLGSWRAYESYTSPLGLGMMHCKARHRDPAPNERVYAHRADANGIGRDRSIATGTRFVLHYREPVRSLYESMETADPNLLLLFHRVPWDHRMDSGLTVWETLQATYRSGVSWVAEAVHQWGALRDQLEPTTHHDIERRLRVQLEHARRWAGTMLDYFGSVQ